MSIGTKIQWTDATFNPWRGCTKVSAGCANCYADKLSKRNPKALGIWGQDGTRVVAAEPYWNQVPKWNAAAKAAGERHRVFCASLADVFEWKDTMPTAAWPEIRSARVRLLALIDATPNLDWLLLTKRIERFYDVLEDVYTETDWDARGGSDDVHDMVREWRLGNAPNNVWLGTSVEDQATADKRIPELLKCHAVVRFLSCEPLLGPIDIRGFWTDAAGPSERLWVIVGGESGPGARPCYTDWFESIRDQCQAAGVPLFVKQLGANHRCVDDEFGDLRIDLKDSKGGDPSEWPEDLRVRKMPEATR